MKTFIHGTSYENIANIIKNGLVSDKDTVWECSRPDMLYCRDKEDDDSLYLCIENGQIAAAYTDSKNTKIGILEISMPDDLADELVEEDDSCENMYGCYQIDIDELNQAIADGKVSVIAKIYEDSYVPYLRPFYLTNLNMEYMNIADSLLMQAIETIKASKAYIEELFDYGECVAEYPYKVCAKA